MFSLFGVMYSVGLERTLVEDNIFPDGFMTAVTYVEPSVLYDMK